MHIVSTDIVIYCVKIWCTVQSSLEAFQQQLLSCTFHNGAKIVENRLIYIYFSISTHDLERQDNVHINKNWILSSNIPTSELLRGKERGPDRGAQLRGWTLVEDVKVKDWSSIHTMLAGRTGKPLTNPTLERSSVISRLLPPCNNTIYSKCAKLARKILYLWTEPSNCFLSVSSDYPVWI